MQKLIYKSVLVKCHRLYINILLNVTWTPTRKRPPFRALRFLVNSSSPSCAAAINLEPGRMWPLASSWTLYIRHTDTSSISLADKKRSCPPTPSVYFRQACLWPGWGWGSGWRRWSSPRASRGCAGWTRWGFAANTCHAIKTTTVT